MYLPDNEAAAQEMAEIARDRSGDTQIVLETRDYKCHKLYTNTISGEVCKFCKKLNCNKLPKFLKYTKKNTQTLFVMCHLEGLLETQR